MREQIRFKINSSNELLKDDDTWFVLCYGNKVRTLDKFETEHVEAAYHAGRQAAMKVKEFAT
jgi:hypothetical protein